MLSGFRHHSNAVRFVTWVLFLAPLLVVAILWAAHQPRFPMLRTALPFFWPLVVASMASLITAIIAWYTRRPLVLIPMVVTVSVATLVMLAGFPFSPVVLFNIAAFAVLAWWARSKSVHAGGA